MAKSPLKIISVVGVRPNLVKIAPILREFKKHPTQINSILIHTGQHFDSNMSKELFADLEISPPDFWLDTQSKSSTAQFGKIMVELEKVFIKEKPHLILVVGDVNSTLAATMVAKRLEIPVVHVEAGLRSFDRTMPEELNRILIDSVSDLLLVSEQAGLDNLSKEGINPDHIHFVGNVMIDSLVHKIKHIKSQNPHQDLNLKEKSYFVLTLHRPSNVDHQDQLTKLVKTISHLAKKAPLVFPIHPRTKNSLTTFNLLSKLDSLPNLILVDPMNYSTFLSLVFHSQGVLTDSGGIQEETTYFQVPCITIRENTERPSTCDLGTNILVGTDHDKIISETTKIISNNHKQSKIPPLWDGKTASRITDLIIKTFLK